MKIVYLLTTPDAAAGTERTFFTQASLMAEHHEVTLLGVYRTAARPHYEVAPGVRLRYLVDARSGMSSDEPSRLVPSEWDNQFSAASDRAVAKALRNLRADVIMTSTPALAALAAEFVGERATIIHQEHRPSMRRGNGIMPLLSHGARLDMITSLTQRSQDWLAERLGAAAPRLRVVENAIEPRYVPRSSLSNRLIVGAGRFTYQKRFDHLIGAFAVANKIEPGWRLRIYGDGPDGDSLLRQIWRHQLEGQVEIVPPTARMAAEMSKASIFGMSSRYEGLPMVAIEAAAAGLPLVAYDVETGPAEVVSKAGGGLLAPDGSVEALGASLAHLMSSPDRLGSLSVRALQGVRSFHPEVIGARWLEVIDEATGTKAGGAPNATPWEATNAQGKEPGDENSGSGASLLAETHLGDIRGCVRPGATDAALQARLESMLDTALSDLGVAHTRMTATDLRQELVVGAEDRDAVIKVLLRLAEENDWNLEAFRGRGRISSGRWTRTDDAPEILPYATHVHVRIAQDRDSGDMSPPTAAMVVVEFWELDEGIRRPPRGNTAVDWVDEQTWSTWTKSDSASVTGRPLWNEFSFPIDVVYTWVDGDDPSWAARRRTHLGEHDAPEDGDGVRAARFFSRDELFYSITAVKKFMPWVRNIYVVTDKQRPQRVVEAFDDVQIVDHSEIFPDPSVLPVFNSHAIETCLHKIEGLSEHFLYFNDDVIPMRPIHPRDFFYPNGIVKFFASPVKINFGGHDDLPHLEAASNNREIVTRRFGFEITQGMLHTPYAHLKSVLGEIEEECHEAVLRTRANRFRSGDDVSMLSSLGQYYGYGLGKYVPGELNYRYVSLRSAGLPKRMLEVLRDRSLHFIALGEPAVGEGHHPEESSLLDAFFAAIVN